MGWSGFTDHRPKPGDIRLQYGNNPPCQFPLRFLAVACARILLYLDAFRVAVDQPPAAPMQLHAAVAPPKSLPVCFHHA